MSILHLDPSRLPLAAVLPDYGPNSLYGLIRAIAARNARPPDGRVELLWLIDGLGDALLQRLGRGGALFAARFRRMRTVFPSTTASVITTLHSTLTPAEHALTGWFVHERRAGGIVAPLPLRRRADGCLRPAQMRALLDYPAGYREARRPVECVQPAWIAGSPYSRHHTCGARLHSYRRLSELLALLPQRVAALARRGGGYLLLYTPELDARVHMAGPRAASVAELFAQFDALFAGLCERLAGWPVDLRVSADHGLIEAAPLRRIFLPATASYRLLERPLYGEARAAFCLVRPGQAERFEASIRRLLGDRGVVLPVAELIEGGLFGPRHRIHRHLVERLGSHALLMSPGWQVVDRLPSEKRPRLRGVHGGLSADEMWVPLIEFRT